MRPEPKYMTGGGDTMRFLLVRALKRSRTLSAHETLKQEQTKLDDLRRGFAEDPQRLTKILPKKFEAILRFFALLAFLTFKITLKFKFDRR